MIQRSDAAASAPRLRCERCGYSHMRWYVSGMTVACYLDPHHEKDELMRLFAKGCGGTLVNRTIPDPEASDHAVVAKGIAAKLVPAFQKAKLGFWYIDSAYIQIQGRREYRIERGRFWPPEDMGTYSMDRAHEMGVRLQPWRKDGSHVLVCQPGPGAGRDFGIDPVAWAGGIRQRLLRKTDRPIRIRPKIMRECKPLADDLEDVWCLVTHSSTAAVEAVIAGIPVFVEPTCAAAPVGRTDLDIENPVYPEREPWVAALAWRQFDRAEVSSGKAWAHVSVTQ